MTNIEKAKQRLTKLHEASQRAGGGLLEDWKEEIGAILNLLHAEQRDHHVIEWQALAISMRDEAMKVKESLNVALRQDVDRLTHLVADLRGELSKAQEALGEVKP